MRAMYRRIISGIKKHRTEIIDTAVMLGMRRTYRRNTICGTKFAVMLVLTVIFMCAVYWAASKLGGAFLLGFGAAIVVCSAFWAVARFWPQPHIPEPEEATEPELQSDILEEDTGRDSLTESGNMRKIVKDMAKETVKGALRGLRSAAKKHGKYKV